jgi:hypothetical protein
LTGFAGGALLVVEASAGAEGEEGKKVESWRGLRIRCEASMNAFPAFEGANVIGCKCEPFAALPFGFEAIVPIALDACRVIGLDVMDWF